MGCIRGSELSINRKILSLLILLACTDAAGQVESSIQYLANEGVMVTHADSKILIDPLFNNSYGQYQLVPDEVREAIFAGQAPYDSVDAVFVSHHHDDHFSADDMLHLLRSQTSIRLYAPAQAVAALRQVAGEDDESVFNRVTGLDLDYGDPPVSIDAGEITIDAVHIPHSGWPTARTDVQNIAFRITLQGDGTVLHLGDADARAVHFTANESYWNARSIDVALAPFWFFSSDAGNDILGEQLDVGHSIGIHVPDAYADSGNIPDELQGYDLFTKPGEQRQFVDSQ